VIKQPDFYKTFAVTFLLVNETELWDPWSKWSANW